MGLAHHTYISINAYNIDTQNPMINASKKIITFICLFDIFNTMPFQMNKNNTANADTSLNANTVSIFLFID